MTKAQERAKGKLTNNWLSADGLRERLSTLERLAALGCAEMRRETPKPGAVYYPRASIYFRRKGD